MPARSRGRNPPRRKGFLTVVVSAGVVGTWQSKRFLPADAPSLQIQRETSLRWTGLLGGHLAYEDIVFSPISRV